MPFPALEMNSGRNLGIDATKELPGRRLQTSLAALIKMDEAVKAKVEKPGEIGIVRGQRRGFIRLLRKVQRAPSANPKGIASSVAK
jgi:hypothetical protein